VRSKRGDRDYEGYRKFRAEVLKRDNFTCQYPSCCVRHELEVHHIKKYSEYHRLRTEVFNGITLCKAHHKKITGKESEYESIFFKKVIANSNQNDWEKLNAPKRFNRKKKGNKNFKRNNIRKRNS
jgi:5-methylcytosine-specific restriction endonuclease McrA